MRLPALLLLTLIAGACSQGDAAKTPARTAADQIAASSGPAEHFESARAPFTMQFPSFWKGSYRAVERGDTTAGARMTVEFVFTPRPGDGEAEHTLFLVRIFPSKAWALVKARPGPPMAIEAGSRGDEVFGLSFATSNPYKAGTPVAAKFDSLMMSVMTGPPGVRLTPK